MKAESVKNPCKRKIPFDEHYFDMGSGEDRCDEMEPDWSGQCDVCEQSPIVPATGLCGPCSFGEAETVHGNW